MARQRAVITRKKIAAINFTIPVSFGGMKNIKKQSDRVEKEAHQT